MDTRPPEFKDGFWHYDIYTNNHTSLWKCSGKYITTLHSVIEPNLASDHEDCPNAQPKVNDDDSIQANAYRDRVTGTDLCFSDPFL